jgi:tetratricopeptide (TPR) repeat protein
MTRLILITVAVLAALWVLLNLGVLPDAVVMVVAPIVGLACSLAVPVVLVTAYAAPGLLRNVVEDVNHFWRRLRTRRRDIDDLEVKIAHLDRPYHLNQLGQIYLAQGRVAKAKPYFERSLAKDATAIDTQYYLASCHFAQKQYAVAVDLLEQVHAQKPEYDYGMAYLRLAQSQQFVGNHARAAEVYRTLLKFYPGHPEGSYHYGLLLADDHSPDEARKMMQDVIFAVRHSPGFHRRRNRHWALKAQWWLWRHRGK